MWQTFKQTKTIDEFPYGNSSKKSKESLNSTKGFFDHFWNTHFKNVIYFNIMKLFGTSEWNYSHTRQISLSHTKYGNTISKYASILYILNKLGEGSRVRKSSGEEKTETVQLRSLRLPSRRSVFVEFCVCFTSVVFPFLDGRRV